MPRGLGMNAQSLNKLSALPPASQPTKVRERDGLRRPHPTRESAGGRTRQRRDDLALVRSRTSGSSHSPNPHVRAAPLEGSLQPYPNETQPDRWEGKASRCLSQRRHGSSLPAGRMGFSGRLIGKGPWLGNSSNWAWSRCPSKTTSKRESSVQGMNILQVHLIAAAWSIHIPDRKKQIDVNDIL
jgi:hypothetical protein